MTEEEKPAEAKPPTAGSVVATTSALLPPPVPPTLETEKPQVIEAAPAETATPSPPGPETTVDPPANPVSPAEVPPNVPTEALQPDRPVPEIQTGVVPAVPESGTLAATDTSALSANPDDIAVVEVDLAKLPEEDSSVELVFGGVRKSKVSIPGERGKSTGLKPTEGTDSEVLSSVDYSIQTAAFIAAEEAPAKIEKPPTIGQLQLKELLSGISMKIVEHAQKLAEAPLIGTVHKDTPQVAPPTSDQASAQVAQPAQAGYGRTVTAAPSAIPLAASEQLLEKKKSSAVGLSKTEDRFPGPDHDDGSRGMPLQQRRSNLNMVIVQEDETTDVEPYEVYSLPDGCEQLAEVPAVLKRYFQAFQDDRQPVGKYFKMEDEDKLNEAAGWDIQPSFKSQPECIIRCSILEKILKGILEFRLSKAPLDFHGRQPKMIMQLLSEDVASTLAQLKFPSYKYGYFVTLVQKNHQDLIISTRQLWDPATDRRVIAKFENRQLHASVVVHFIFHP